MSSTTPIAVVSGANRGLGLATSRTLAELGYRVLMLGRNAGAIQSAAGELAGEGLDVVPLVVDVTDDEAIALVQDRLEHHEGPVRILVNNAGILPDSAGDDPDGASAMRGERDLIVDTFQVNTVGALKLAQAVAPSMSDGGNIVNVSSGMGQLSEMEGHYPAYRISKTALNAVTRMLANELAERGIKVNSVCPGWVQTDMGGANATRTIAEGIAGIIWAATLGDDGPSGGFFRDGQRLDW